MRAPGAPARLAERLSDARKRMRKRARVGEWSIRAFERVVVGTFGIGNLNPRHPNPDLRTIAHLYHVMMSVDARGLPPCARSGRRHDASGRRLSTSSGACSANVARRHVSLYPKASLRRGRHQKASRTLRYRLRAPWTARRRRPHRGLEAHAAACWPFHFRGARVGSRYSLQQFAF